MPVETLDRGAQGGKPGTQASLRRRGRPPGARPEGGEQALDVRLRRGVTLRGRVVGPDDKPAGSFVLFSRSYRVSGYTLCNHPDLLRCVTDSQFELPGCDPDRLTRPTCSTPPTAWGRRLSSPRRTRSSRRPSACGRAGPPAPRSSSRTASRSRSTGPVHLPAAQRASDAQLVPPAISTTRWRPTGVCLLAGLGLIRERRDGQRRTCHLPGPRARGQVPDPVAAQGCRRPKTLATPGFHREVRRGERPGVRSAVDKVIR